MFLAIHNSHSHTYTDPRMAGRIELAVLADVLLAVDLRTAVQACLVHRIAMVCRLLLLLVVVQCCLIVVGTAERLLALDGHERVRLIVLALIADDDIKC